MKARHFTHELSRFPGSYVRLSEAEPVDTAVVFVHGFNGDSQWTWANFQLLIDDTESTDLVEWWSHADLYFLQYESVIEHLQSSSDTSRDFLNSIYPVPDAALFLQDVRCLWGLPEDLESVPEAIVDANGSIVSVLPSDRQYSKLILVGHSEGGAIIRQCILDQIQTAGVLDSTTEDRNGSRPGFMSARLRLFAPALFGYSPSGLLGILVRLPFLGSVTDAVLSASPSYQDLRHPSEFLKLLRDKTERCAQQDHSPALRASILWGTREQILKVGRYEQDTIYAHVKGSDHAAICKPTQDYLTPLEFQHE
jgi:pimeloyl-ACP methyl ester carboxylesterase